MLGFAHSAQHQPTRAQHRNIATLLGFALRAQHQPTRCAAEQITPCQRHSMFTKIRVHLFIIRIKKMMTSVAETIHNQVFTWADVIQTNFGLSDNATVFALTGLNFAAGLALFYVVRPIFLTIMARISSRERSVWLKAAYQNKVFHRITWVIPGLVVLITSPVLSNAKLPLASLFAKYLEMGSEIYLTCIAAAVISAFLNTIEKRFMTFKLARKFSIKTYMQIVRLVLYSLTGIVVVAIMIGKSPMYLLTGLGAMTAVGMLIFRDSILGFAASIQFAAYDILRIGDWVEIPKYGVDGNVLDISLTTIKIKNFDNTVMFIPTATVLNESVKNWRGMSESGGRRIKRFLTVNIKSVKLLNSEQLAHYANIPLLQDKLKEHINNDKRYIDAHTVSLVKGSDQRCISNLTVFRLYLEAYLTNHPAVHNDMTFLIRELQHTNYGIPLEIYIFLNVTEWSKYEAIQSEIFDYIYTVLLPVFELEAFQYKAESTSKQDAETIPYVGAQPASVSAVKEA